MDNNILQQSPQLWFRDICRRNGLEIAEKQLAQLAEAVRLLLAWNQRINLIARTDEANIWNRHLLGSVSFLFRFALPTEASVIDVGTGGGFPGVPLAILHPELNFILVDSIRKKIAVVEDIVDQLNLPNVTTRCARAEELSEIPEHYHRYDLVVARAVAPTSDLIRWTSGFLAPNAAPPLPEELPRAERAVIPSGSMVFLKGGELGKELEEARIKRAPRSIREYALIVDGIDPADASDKKVVIVQP